MRMHVIVYTTNVNSESPNMADVDIFSSFYYERHVCDVANVEINRHAHETGVAATQNVPLSYRASYYSQAPLVIFTCTTTLAFIV